MNGDSKRLRRRIARAGAHVKRAAPIALIIALAAGLAGCEELADIFKTDESRFLSPFETVRQPKRSPIAPILTTASPADVTEEILPNAEFPVESDYQYSEEDYIIGPNDVLDIGILDLFQPGQETVVRRQVEGSGFIDLPLLEQRIRAEGMTAQQLRQAIMDIYSPDLLRDPRVSVAVVARRQTTFSILGSVSGPGTYDITRRDMRLYDAIALARGVTNPTIRYIYVIRPLPAEPTEAAGPPPSDGPAEVLPPPPTLPNGLEVPEALPPLPGQLPSLQPTPSDETEGIDVTAPPAADPSTDFPADGIEGEPGALPALPGSAEPEPTTQPGAEDDHPSAEPAGVPPSVALAADSTHPSTALLAYVQEVAVASPPGGGVREPQDWVFRNGRWVRREEAEASFVSFDDTEDGPGDATTDDDVSPDDQGDDPFGWNRAARADMARIIAINLQRLYDGDPRMNIIIRANDIIRIPTLEVGEFYIYGRVNRPGVYSLTGRRVTVKMALAAAGNLDELAWPSNSVLIRRIGENQEQVVPINIEKIFRNEESDIFLKPNDVVAVGTHPAASFMAVVRNAFRLSYGFGFIYDRNFGSPASGEGNLNSKRFSEW